MLSLRIWTGWTKAHRRRRAYQVWGSAWIWLGGGLKMRGGERCVAGGVSRRRGPGWRVGGTFSCDRRALRLAHGHAAFIVADESIGGCGACNLNPSRQVLNWRISSSRVRRVAFTGLGDRPWISRATSS